jgi:hypothetical protein
VGKAMPPWKGEKALGALIRKSNVDFFETLDYVQVMETRSLEWAGLNLYNISWLASHFLLYP